MLCSDSSHMEPEHEETLGYSHKVIGIIGFAFLMLQVGCVTWHSLAFMVQQYV
jgi:hypothetical protein